jgi:PKHD-type hydroxylase
MLHIIQDALTTQEVQQCRALLRRANWGDGRSTAGTQSAQVKNNQQLPERDPIAITLRNIILQALSDNAQLFTCALPRRIFPPLFNRYSGLSNSFGDHVDNAIRTHATSAQHLRTDLSFTLFLNEPQEYEGGELVIHQLTDDSGIKLAAGSLLLYPSGTLHRVNPVTIGERLAAFSWIESMVRETAQRDLLFQMDIAIMKLRAEQGDTEPVVELTACYHNLLRQWASV